MENIQSELNDDYDVNTTVILTPNRNKQIKFSKMPYSTYAKQPIIETTTA